MFKRIGLIMLLAMLLSIFALPVAAAPEPGDGGGFYFGPYTINSGDTTTGDLTVFGTVTMEDGATLDGTLTVFGALEMGDETNVTNDVTVFGSADISGLVDGDLFVAGETHLNDGARITGDVSTSNLIQDENVEIEGEIKPYEEPQSIQIGPLGFNPQAPQEPPLWAKILMGIGQSIFLMFVTGLFALVPASFWPQPTQRIGRAVVEAPMASFVIGLIALCGIPVILALMAATLCLIPPAAIGFLLFLAGLALGIFGIGAILGERILPLFHITPNLVTSTVCGSVILVAAPLLIGIFPNLECVSWALMLLILMPAAGAVILTRFGTMPYATRGIVPPIVPGTPTMPTPPTPPTPPAPFNMPFDVAPAPVQNVPAPVENAPAPVEETPAEPVEPEKPAE